MLSIYRKVTGLDEIHSRKSEKPSAHLGVPSRPLRLKLLFTLSRALNPKIRITLCNKMVYSGPNLAVYFAKIAKIEKEQEKPALCGLFS
jgi:hypothetical protein